MYVCLYVCMYVCMYVYIYKMKWHLCTFQKNMVFWWFMMTCNGSSKILMKIIEQPIRHGMMKRNLAHISQGVAQPPTTNHQPPTSSWLYPHYTSISIFVGFPFFNSSSSGDANHGGWGGRCVEGPDQWANLAELTSSLGTKMGWTLNSAVNHLPFGVLKYGWQGNSL